MERGAEAGSQGSTLGETRPRQYDDALARRDTTPSDTRGEEAAMLAASHAGAGSFARIPWRDSAFLTPTMALVSQTCSTPQLNWSATFGLGTNWGSTLLNALKRSTTQGVARSLQRGSFGISLRNWR